MGKKRKEPEVTKFSLPNGETVRGGDAVDVLFTKSVYIAASTADPPAFSSDKIKVVQAWIMGYYVFDFYYFTPMGEQKIKNLPEHLKNQFHNPALIPLYRKWKTRLMPEGRNLYDSRPIAFKKEEVRKHRKDGDAITFEDFYLVSHGQADIKFAGYESKTEDWDKHSYYEERSR